MTQIFLNNLLKLVIALLRKIQCFSRMMKRGNLKKNKCY